VLVVIETPKGSPNKFAFEPRFGTFVLKGVLPAGAVFPFDFGFVPSTRAEDGDPVDVLVLMDAPAFPGCVVPSRLVGVIEAEQTEGGKTERTIDSWQWPPTPQHIDRFGNCATSVRISLRRSSISSCRTTR
jgi:inorganic pyrophosphatase